MLEKFVPIDRQERSLRVAELSRTSGVPVPSIKYYLRAGLLPAGERTAPNQAEYGAAHVHRLRLIRALIEVGGLPVAVVKEVLESMDSSGTDLLETLGAAFKATLPVKKVDDSENAEAAWRTVDQLIEKHGWIVNEDSPNKETLASALAVLYRLGQNNVDEIVDAYATHAEQLGEQEIDWVVKRGTPDEIVEAAVVGTFIGGAVFNAIRVIVHESVSRKNLQNP